jgi:hypothetical protein
VAELGDPVTDREVVYDSPLTVGANPLTAVGEASYNERVLRIWVRGGSGQWNWFG